MHIWVFEYLILKGCHRSGTQLMFNEHSPPGLCKASRARSGNVTPVHLLVSALTQRACQPHSSAHLHAHAGLWARPHLAVSGFLLMTASGVQLLARLCLLLLRSSESAVCVRAHLHACPLFWICLPFRSPQSTEQSFLCSAVCSH